MAIREVRARFVDFIMCSSHNASGYTSAHRFLIRSIGMIRRVVFALLFLCSISFAARSEPVAIDAFDSIDAWEVRPSDGVKASLERLDLPDGRHAMRLNFSFDAGSGYAVIRRPVKLDLPRNYRFLFNLRARTPINNFEFKLVDAADENVWWVNNKAFEDPGDWTPMQYRARHLGFAWGPSGGKAIEKLGWIEFAVTAFDGGKGWVDLSDLRYEALAETRPPTQRPGVRATLNAYGNGIDGREGETSIIFESKEINEDGTLNLPVFKRQTLTSPHLIRMDVDMKEEREFGGLILDWDRDDFPMDYDVFLSADGKGFEPFGKVRDGLGGRRYLPVRDGVARKVRFDITKTSRGLGVRLDRVEVAETSFSSTMSAAWTRIASEDRRGMYPRWTRKQQPYWTVVGVGGDTKEALLNTDGAIEVDKLGFTVEPMIRLKGESRAITWSDVETRASLEDDDLPIPSTTWTRGAMTLKVTALADGEAERSVLLARYLLTNAGNEAIEGELALGLRPFQVLPPWQELNISGGASRVPMASVLSKRAFPTIQMGQKIVQLLTPSDDATFGVSDFMAGDALARWAQGAAPTSTDLSDAYAACSAVMVIPFSIAPGKSESIVVGWPFHDQMQDASTGLSEGRTRERVAAYYEERLRAQKKWWREQVSKVDLTLPPSGKRIADTFRSQQAYILVNRDGVSIQPGSRTYERSWIRDGCLTGNALLATGHIDEVREFVDWYAPFQYTNGKVPCVVDRRGPDPVLENDSHGELIYAIASVYRYTRDKAFLQRHLEHVEKAIEFIESLRAQRMTDEYRSGSPEKRALYGLVTESISHEGYSAKPMHSYWDSFFTIAGLKDAVFIARELGRGDLGTRWSKLRDDYKACVYDSMRLAMSNTKIDYIPGCAELGDFDATSTTVGIWPADELGSIPEPQLHKTFDKWYGFFHERLDPASKWKDYTPYEVRLMGSYVRLGEPARAWELMDFYLHDQRPQGWNHWAEVVHRDPDFPGYIGDMPHTWVGSDFVNSVRSMFAYEHAGHLVVAAGVKPDWTSEKEADGVVRGVRVARFPTEFGTLTYSMVARDDGTIVVNIGDGLRAAPGLIDLAIPQGAVHAAEFNGKAIAGDSLKQGRIVLDGSPGTLVVHPAGASKP
jgi:hypothetical protein